MVPNGWKQKLLTEVVFINPPKTARPMDSRVSFIPMDAVSEDARLLRLEERQYERVEKGFTSFKDDDVLIAKITPCFENGKGAIVSGLKNGIGFGSTEFHVLRAKSNICSRFIYYVTVTQEFRVRGEINMQGSADQKRVTTDYLKTLKVLLPPLSEQKKIVRILSTWDNAITITEKLLANSEQQKKALMQQLLTGKKRLPGFVCKWKEINLGELATLTTGGTPSTKTPEYWDGEIPWMTSGEINLKQVRSVEGRITNLGLKKSSTKKIPANSILIALAGQGKTRGTVAISRIRLCINQSIAAIMPSPEKLDGEFLYFNLDSRYQELRTMSTGDGGRGGLNLSILKSIKLKLPPIDEQKKIAIILAIADQEIDKLKQELDCLKQEKKALMQQLLTGKRRVTVN